MMIKERKLRIKRKNNIKIKKIERREIQMRPIEEYNKMLPNQAIRTLIQDSLKENGVTADEALMSIGLGKYVDKAKNRCRY